MVWALCMTELCGRDGYNVTKVLWSHGTIFVHMVHGRSKCHYVSRDCCMTLPPTIKTQKTWSDLTLAPQLVLVGMECELGCCFLSSMLVTLMACVPWFQKWIPHLPYIFCPCTVISTGAVKCSNVDGRQHQLWTVSWILTCESLRWAILRQVPAPMWNVCP